ncbi:MAG: haloacid dehalogenase-like hydrolase [Eggerthellaceae bacterium]|nr:haloacid dehalogenase-like hydrolase [Eggerthellaceae bacterium]
MKRYSPDQPKQKLAVYDFDGTCISGNSPVMLVKYLIRRRQLDPWAATRIGAWALAYKLRLPQNESWVRWLVFKAFDGVSQEEVDTYLANFYEDVVAKRYRPEADESMRQMADKGCLVVVVSATWQAIVDQAAKSHPFDVGISTRMLVDGLGNYTRFVDGLPIEGEEKVRAVRRFADARFGPGNWELEYAFGDHHSDVHLLEMANHPCAVTPDNPLGRIAKRRNWEVLNWKKPSASS